MDDERVRERVGSGGLGVLLRVRREGRVVSVASDSEDAAGAHLDGGLGPGRADSSLGRGGEHARGRLGISFISDEAATFGIVQASRSCSEGRRAYQDCESAFAKDDETFLPLLAGGKCAIAVSIWD